MVVRLHVTEQDEGIRLDRFFKRHYPYIHFTQIAKLIRKKIIRVNGKKALPSCKIHAGDLLLFPEFKEVKSPLKVINPILIEEVKNTIIYKDNNIIALNKPAGLAVQGGSGVKISLDDLTQYLKFELDEKPKLVHRLDKATTGIMVIARSANAAAKVSEVIREGGFNKTYLALCHNIPKGLSGKIELLLTKGKEKMYAESLGSNSLTHYQVISSVGTKYSLIKVNILTGKTHQIRVHLASIGCPIIGDEKYGTGRLDEADFGKWLYLHSYELSFALGDGTNYNFIASLPKHFELALDFLNLKNVEIKK